MGPLALLSFKKEELHFHHGIILVLVLEGEGSWTTVLVLLRLGEFIPGIHPRISSRCHSFGWATVLYRQSRIKGVFTQSPHQEDIGIGFP